ncbi:bifunctional aspartate kinase/homoserine dehydrogenase I [Lacihabitans sp. CS3-21]|uniref:bifunctional aspartate kinase/homoserine dehydrogenase I n=1 Tax=Lacihabitans sp. CS3-21 TaxID=2487332 RepID=UPI0020CCEAEF|nr:bifunctional aspartate kinase/homoserine dehydrogenase I [Lacihabitans sp. CS3-21]MCP9747633.1 bifunctional aspartate kinase/homoserine dehydrogenase I [Lacihabitans sp. CS3-21]
MKVLKFGGTSVGTVDSINQVIRIISENKQPIAVVYSAMGGVTNKLIEIGTLASKGDLKYLDVLQSIEERHFSAIRALVDVKSQSSIIAKIKGNFNEIEDLLKGITFIRELSIRTMDLLLSFGERLSTQIITFVLNEKGINAKYIDARDIIKTNSNFGFAEVDFEKTNALINSSLAEKNQVYCITGFIASNKDNITTTLGRGGSDYTASIIGAALGSEVIEIWTDVNGMMTADPRKVKNAFTIPDISYSEAMELSHFGAKVIYPPSLVPAFIKNIPIKVLNTFESSHSGTTISKEINQKGYSITGISSIDEISLVNLQGNGMIGVAGVSAKLFGLLADNKISVILISQASSEHSICFAVDPKSAENVREILEDGFKAEILNGDIENISIQNNLSIIAVVGEGMKSSSGTSGKLFSVLGKNGINVIATAQGSSELNISVVIKKKDISKALNAIHETFFEIDGFTLNLYLVGPSGQIGKTLLKQIAQQSGYLKKEKNLNIKITGLANTKKMLLDSNGIALENWKENLETAGEKINLSEFITDIQTLNLANSIFVDCSADKDIVQYYYPLLDSNISIVTPNKVANSGTYEEYLALRNIAKKRNVKFLYETNVGAGLPLINTLQGLINSGDRIHKIEAVLSGTLSFIFNTFAAGLKFVDVVKEAKAKGFTEPDPRDDLSGTDVARKILILARECGIKLEFNEVENIPLLSADAMAAKSVDDFYAVLENENSQYENLLNEALEKGKVLRFIASLENGKAKLGLTSVGKSPPFYNLAGSENIVSFTTERYFNNPLVIKGPGAGAEVTAMGVFADIISLSSFLA